MSRTSCIQASANSGLERAETQPRRTRPTKSLRSASEKPKNQRRRITKANLLAMGQEVVASTVVEETSGVTKFDAAPWDGIKTAAAVPSVAECHPGRSKMKTGRKIEPRIVAGQKRWPS